jgi:signal transduction histidine kinase
MFSALSHDVRATINGINVWTHILERVTDQTAARAVDGIRRSIAQQTELAQEISDFGRDVYAAPGEQPVELDALLRNIVNDLREFAPRVRLRSSETPAYTPVHHRTLHTLLRLLVRDAMSALTEDGSLNIAVESADDTHWRVRIGIVEPDGMHGDLTARPPLRQALAMVAARLHEIPLEIGADQRTLLLPRIG